VIETTLFGVLVTSTTQLAVLDPLMLVKSEDASNDAPSFRLNMLDCFTKSSKGMSLSPMFPFLVSDCSRDIICPLAIRADPPSVLISTSHLIT
jgi:hypothetical protein